MQRNAERAITDTLASRPKTSTVMSRAGLCKQHKQLSGETRETALDQTGKEDKRFASTETSDLLSLSICVVITFKESPLFMIHT